MAQSAPKPEMTPIGVTAAALCGVLPYHPTIARGWTQGASPALEIGRKVLTLTFSPYQ
jgi:hypothetical protein